MRSTIKSILSLILAFALAFTVQISAETKVDHGTLFVVVTGLKNNQGSVRIALFNSAATYKAAGYSGKNAYRAAMLPISNGHAMWRVSHLPYGMYAIKLFHDENGSGKLRVNILGIPREGYGFSNNPPTSRGPASYDQAAFKFQSKIMKVAIRMVNR